MKRLAYLTFYREMGGAEVCLLTLLEGLDRTRFTPLVVLSGPGPLADELGRRRVPLVFEPRLRHLTRGTRSPAGLLRNARDFLHVQRALRRLLRSERIDLVHAFVTPALKYGGAAARLNGIPAVGSMHDLLRPPFSRLKRRLIAANVNLNYRRLIVPSRASEAEARRAGVRPAKLAVVPSGVDTGRFAGDATARARVRAELGLARETSVLGMVSRFAPLKGHDLLLRAVSELARHHDDLRCVIVGDAVFEGEAAWKDRTLRLAAELGLDSRVIFTGWRRDVADVLSAFDVFVQPSSAEDSFPTSALEAMAAGLPVVAGAGGSAAEIVVPGVTGYLVAPGAPNALAEAILELVRAPAAARAMGEAGRERAAREFSRERYCRAIERVYDTVLGS